MKNYKQYIIVLMVLILRVNAINSQISTQSWIIGSVNPDTLNDQFSLCELKFEDGKRSIEVLRDNINCCGVHSSSYSNKEGKLKLYSNGLNIFDHQGIVINNGRGISPGNLHNNAIQVFGRGGYGNTSTSQFLSFEDTSAILMIHSGQGFDKQGRIHNTPLYYTVIEQSNGEYIVVEKNVKITTNYLTGFDIVRHGNQSSWWVIAPHSNDGTVVSYLFEKGQLVDSTISINDFELNYDYQIDFLGECQVSPRGNLFAECDRANGIFLYNVDRCSGEVSKLDLLFPNYINSSSNLGSLSFSPSEQYLYYGDYNTVTQVDLKNTDINTCSNIIAKSEYYTGGNQSHFMAMALAPDEKIYIVASGNSPYIHIINRPDYPGLRCDLRQNALMLDCSTWINLPDFPVDPGQKIDCDSFQSNPRR